MILQAGSVDVLHCFMPMGRTMRTLSAEATGCLIGEVLFFLWMNMFYVLEFAGVLEILIVCSHYFSLGQIIR